MRPLAVPRSASAATSSSFSFSAFSVARPRAASPSSRSFIARSVLGLLVGRLAHRPPSDARWIADDRVRRVVGGELLAQVLAHLRHDLGRSPPRTRCCTAAERLVAEVLGQRLRDVAVLGPEHLVDLRVEPLGDRPRLLANAASTFRPRCEVARRSPRACSRSSTRAPISTICVDEPVRVLARSRALAQLDRGLVVDAQPVDDQRRR